MSPAASFRNFTIKCTQLSYLCPSGVPPCLTVTRFSIVNFHRHQWHSDSGLNLGMKKEESIYITNTTAKRQTDTLIIPKQMHASSQDVQ